MKNTLSIRSSKDLITNYAQISALTRKNPAAITVNGKKDTVILSHDAFVEQQKYISDVEARLAVYNHLAQAQDDINLGRVQNLDNAICDILNELDGFEF
ncbi:MAG: hypothetical protein ACI4WM_06085 [Erysipelotrichaceae bacterium]